MSEGLVDAFGELNLEREKHPLEYLARRCCACCGAPQPDKECAECHKAFCATCVHEETSRKGEWCNSCTREIVQMAPHCFRYSQFVVMERERKPLLEEVQRLTAILDTERQNTERERKETERRELAQAELVAELHMRISARENEIHELCVVVDRHRQKLEEKEDRIRELEDEQQAGCLYCGNTPKNVKEAVIQD